MLGSLYAIRYHSALSATESEKSKAGLKYLAREQPWCTRRSKLPVDLLFTLAVRTISEVLTQECPEEYQDFWNGMSQYLDWFDTLIGQSDLCVLTGTTFVQTIERLLMSGLLNIYMLVVLT